MAYTDSMNQELVELRQLLLGRKASMSGRTLWLGGTEVAKRREASQFNCSFLKVETVNDVVDAFWLLLQGCGVGFMPVVGSLSGFIKNIPNIEVVRSERTNKGGSENNEEIWDADQRRWTVKAGDSAEAWAKFIGKLVAGKYPASTLVLDFSNIRPSGDRVTGYGWYCSGDGPLAEATYAICRLLNRRAGQLLRRLDILDIINWLGTVLSTRRASEIALLPYGDPEYVDFARAKDHYWEGNVQRAQSNNSLVFYKQPSKADLSDIFNMMFQCGGSEPGFVNGEAALLRAPWFSGVNPCAEVLLSNKAFCNLTEVDLAKFKDNHAALERAVWLIARANYRQTLVDLNDGILQTTWHQNNEALHLCGVGLTGIARRPDLTPYDYRQLKNIAVLGAYGMADELGTPRPKNVTTVKPSGTLSKIMDTTEGCHKPMGRYIFNNVNFSVHDPLVADLKAAGYRVFPNPLDKEGMLVTFPVAWNDVPFERVGDLEVNRESATDQLERYKMLMTNWSEQNVSITVSYDEGEVPEIVDWLHRNWDDYVGVSFLPRVDPTKTAEDIGYAYLPQEVVSKQTFDQYTDGLGKVDITGSENIQELREDDCAGGHCPIK